MFSIRTLKKIDALSGNSRQLPSVESNKLFRLLFSSCVVGLNEATKMYEFLTKQKYVRIYITAGAPRGLYNKQLQSVDRFVYLLQDHQSNTLE